jgi:hypothetical protein
LDAIWAASLTISNRVAVLIREDAEPVEVNSAAQIREGRKMSQFRQIREERMKTRIFSVLGLLLLCGVITTWGGKAWAGLCGGAGPVSCLSGSYSCTGAGIWGDATDPTSREDSFSSSGVLNISNLGTGTQVMSPGSAGWDLNAGGSPQVALGVSSGTIAQNGTSGQGQMTLAWSPLPNPVFEFNGDATLVPMDFNYVVNTVNGNGVAAEFTLQAIPGAVAAQEEVVWLMDCRLQ